MRIFFLIKNNLILLFLVFLVSGCNTAQSPTVNAISNKNTPFPPTSTSVPKTNTPIPSPTSTPMPTQPSCFQEQGEVLALTYTSDQLPSFMNYLVYLPPCYHYIQNVEYPVLYLIHGQTYDHTQWVNLGINTEADQLIRDGEIAPLVIVMPQDRTWTPPEVNNFGKVLIEELIPLIEEDYRTVTNREFRAIGGLSRGAAWAIHLSLRNWDIFSKLGAHSPAIFWADGTKNSALLEEIVKSFPVQQGKVSIYIDVADEDEPEIIHSANLFLAQLDQVDFPYSFQIFPGAHLESYWAKHVEQYLRFYTSGW